MNVDLRLGDCQQVLSELEAASVQTCITSPPYFGLRDYGVEGQIGLEQTFEAYVAKMVEVFRQVRRVLKDDGTLWLNLGDSYASGGGSAYDPKMSKGLGDRHRSITPAGTKEKDLIGIPWAVAFALRNDGWYLRSDIIWHKPNAMPEPVTDRPTKAHENLFLLSKQPHYYYDAKAVREACSANSHGSPNIVPGWKNTKLGHVGGTLGKWTDEDKASGRNRRSVWTIPTKAYKRAHFATFPTDLIDPCVLAGSREGDTVLDPFSGAGTTGVVAVQRNRHYLGIELSAAYMELSRERIEAAQIKAVNILGEDQLLQKADSWHADDYIDGDGNYHYELAITITNTIRDDSLNKRIAELTAKIPVGTYCDEENHCGGYLTADEEDELNRLFYLQSQGVEE